jgi:putative nucleotidyltransferase with HDIG domain
VPAALSALGAGGLRTTVEAAPVHDPLATEATWRMPLEPFRQHAVATRRALDRILRELGRPGDDALSGAALLHDLGKVVLAEAHPGYAGWSAARGRPVADRLRAERRAFGLDHAALSALAARRWGLSGRIVDAIGDHHAPGADRDGAILALADALAHVAAGTRPGAELEVVASAAGLSRAGLRAAMLDVPIETAHRGDAAAPCPLTATELTVLRQIGEGRTVAQIAGERGVSVSTIRGHLHNAYRRLGVVDRTQAVLVARRRGWL